jgi:hypothetical protein
MSDFPESDLTWIPTAYSGYHQANLILKLVLFEDRLEAELSCKGRVITKATVAANDEL